MKAILVISFGTTYSETRVKTIDAIESLLAESFPDRKLYRAWTSKFILKKLASRDGVHYDDLSESFERMKSDGITDVMIQPTQVIPGAEYQKIVSSIEEHRSDFESCRLGRPLLSSQEDLETVVSAIMNEFPDLGEDEALVLMGHGSPDGSNDVYVDLERTFHEKGYPNVFVGTVEAEPGLTDVLTSVFAASYNKVCLAPLLVVAGDHALNDMAGDQEDSWTSVFRAHGCSVRCCVRGIGEYPGVRNMYLQHANDAMTE